MVARETVTIVARYVGGIVEKPCVGVEVVGATCPPCLVWLGTGLQGLLCRDLSSFNTRAIDLCRGISRSTRRWHKHYAARDSFLHRVDQANALAVVSLHQPVGCRILFGCLDSDAEFIRERRASARHRLVPRAFVGLDPSDYQAAIAKTQSRIHFGRACNLFGLGTE